MKRVAAKAKLRVLTAAVDGDDERSVYEAALAVADEGVKEAIPLLLKLLSEDRRIRVRDGAALALRELRANQAVPELIRLIRHPANKQTRGTLVYALQTLDWYREHAVYVATLLTVENYEVRQMALQALEAVVDDLSDQQKSNVLVGLSIALLTGRRLGHGARETWIEALKLLTGKENPVELAATA